MTKAEVKKSIEQCMQVYRIAYEAWKQTGSEACKQEAQYWWDKASEASDKYMSM